MDEENQTVIVVAPTTEAAIEGAVVEAIKEVHEEVDVKSLLTKLLETINLRFDGVERSLAEVISREANVQDVTHAIVEEVRELETTIEEVVKVAVDEVEAAEELADTIEQIDNDIEVDANLVEEVLATNDVVDAIAPNIKKERKRLRFI